MIRNVNKNLFLVVTACAWLTQSRVAHHRAAVAHVSLNGKRSTIKLQIFDTALRLVRPCRIKHVHPWYAVAFHSPLLSFYEDAQKISVPSRLCVVISAICWETLCGDTLRAIKKNHSSLSALYFDIDPGASYPNVFEHAINLPIRCPSTIQ